MNCQSNTHGCFRLFVDNKSKNRTFRDDKNENQLPYDFLTVSGKNDATRFEHAPVLLREAVSSLEIEKNLPITVVDATLGLWGHSKEILTRLPPGSTYVGFDRDPKNLEDAKSRLLAEYGETLSKKGISASFVRSDFRHLEESLQGLGISEIDAILYDLGVSSAHYDDSERGFSFRFDGPLDMRFDRENGEADAAKLLNRASEAELLRIFREYGEEPKAFFIAKAIVEQRKTAPLATTFEFLSLIEKASFDPKSKVRTFQAVRIAVNDEFGSIESSLKQAVRLLRMDGRLSVITFHSVEDRIVKTVLKSFERDVPDPFTGKAVEKAQLKRVFKKPIEPSKEEIETNPRSRSAKLRVSKKIQ